LERWTPGATRRWRLLGLLLLLLLMLLVVLVVVLLWLLLWVGVGGGVLLEQVGVRGSVRVLVGEGLGVQGEGRHGGAWRARLLALAHVALRAEPVVGIPTRGAHPVPGIPPPPPPPPSACAHPARAQALAWPGQHHPCCR